MSDSQVVRLAAASCLSASMIAGLELVAQGPVDDCALLINLGDRRKATLKALERRGLVRWCPYGGKARDGHWRITADGRSALDEIDSDRARLEHQAKVDEVVRSWRESS